MTELQVSVILPVYNVAKYLHQAMDSVLGQTLKEIEIICVDDGSTDESYEILEEYAQKDNRITLIQQKNQGAGVARNTGLAVARGKYLLFLDPDDFFEFNMVEELYERAEKLGVEIVISPPIGFNESTKKPYEIHRFFKKENIPQKDFFSYLDMEEHIFSSFGFAPWNKFYQREFIIKNNIKFQEIFRGDDMFFTMIALISAKKITTLDKKFVHYRTNMETAGKRKIVSYPLSYCEACLATKEVLVKHQVSEKTYLNFLQISLNAMMVSFWREKNFENYRKLYLFFQDIMEKELGILSKKGENFPLNQYEAYQKIIETPFSQFLHEQWQKEQEKNALNQLNLLSRLYQHLCFFGAGAHARNMLTFFRENNFPLPVTICDNSSNLQGSFLDGIPVISVEEMAEQFENFGVLLTVMNPTLDIYHQLEKVMKKEDIFTVKI